MEEQVKKECSLEEIKPTVEFTPKYKCCEAS